MQEPNESCAKVLLKTQSWSIKEQIVNDYSTILEILDDEMSTSFQIILFLCLLMYCNFQVKKVGSSLSSALEFDFRFS